MKLEGIPFTGIDWKKVAVAEHAGETGSATWRTFEQGNVRVRLVEYSAGYKADHWCSRGHVIHVLEGTLVTELQDGRAFTTEAGSTYVVEENGAPHRSTTVSGAKLFIVD
ncbi:MAG TPA: DHCW motif cupin fold protein [Terriglobales bacterium]|nr:DHCW motif cupin fold protein [Terriglobales bacterium]